MNAWYKTITSVTILGVAAALTAGCASQTVLTGSKSVGQSLIAEAGGSHVPGRTGSLASGDSLGMRLFETHPHDIVDASASGSAMLTRLEEMVH